MNYVTYLTHNNTGVTNQYPQFANSATDFVNMFNTANSNTTIYSQGIGPASTTLVVNNVSFESGGYTLPSGLTFNQLIGMKITGTGIPAETWVTNISGSGPSYTLTLNNPLTQQASGNYHMQVLVYSGSGPANVFENYYGNIYVLSAYYDNYGNRSKIGRAHV